MKKKLDKDYRGWVPYNIILFHFLYKGTEKATENIHIVTNPLTQQQTRAKLAMFGAGGILGFKDSPEHNGNMLSNSHKYLGIGCYIDDNYTYWTQRFSSLR